MPEPKLELAAKYLTNPQARKRLGLSRFQFNIRVERGVFPRPTYVDTVICGGVTQHVHYFDENWVRIAKAIMESAPGNSGDLDKSK